MKAYLARVAEVIIDPVIQLIFFAAFLFFAWGIFVFVSNADNPQKQGEGKQHMFWGIIGMVIMVSADIVLELVKNTLSEVAEAASQGDLG